MWDWVVAADPVEVHALLCACDRHQAERSCTPIPVRRIETTEWHVHSSAVHLLRGDGAAAAMFTLTAHPPFDEPPDRFDVAANPRYLQRLAVRPDLLETGALLGARCVRKAVELASAQGADTLRCEANPDLGATLSLLEQLGFRRRGRIHDAGAARQLYLERRLAGMLSPGL